MNQKGLAPILIVLLITAIAGIGGYFIYTNYSNSRSRTTSAPMEMKPVGELCDLNEDGKCDESDHKIFLQSLGRKVGEAGYNLNADVNADGVVMIDDEKILFPVTLPVESSTSAETANWKTYTITPDSSLGYASYQMKLPTEWKQIEHSSNFQSTETFQDGQNIYKLVIEEQKNYNNQTKRPFADLKEVTGLSYDVLTLTVDGQQASRPLPRAGSEHIYGALFFSKDAKLVFSLILETPRDGSKIREGELLFNQILSTFKFIP